jgi:hypothetical protein
MTLTQVAVLLIRIFSIHFFVSAIVVLTEMPSMIFSISETKFTSIIYQSEFNLFLLMVRLFTYVGAGVFCLVFARPVAKLFIKGLDKHE